MAASATNSCASSRALSQAKRHSIDRIGARFGSPELFARLDQSHRQGVRDLVVARACAIGEDAERGAERGQEMAGQAGLGVERREALSAPIAKEAGDPTLGQPGHFDQRLPQQTGIAADQRAHQQSHGQCAALAQPRHEFCEFMRRAGAGDGDDRLFARVASDPIRASRIEPVAARRDLRERSCGGGGDVGAQGGGQARAHRQLLAHRGVLAEPIKNAAQGVVRQLGVEIAGEREHRRPLAHFR